LEDLILKNHLRDLWLEHGRLHGAEIYLLAVLIISGTIACFLLPISGGYDEEQHLMRVWEMSDYTFLPNEKLGNELPFPRVYWEMSYRRESIVRAVPPDFWKKYGNLSLDAHDYIYNINTRSVYSPPLLLPQALVMRFLGRSRQWPALTVYYICRLAGLLTYILLTLLAVRLIPYGKWILAILATSPVAILQAATITPDTISNGIALLFIAGSLATAVKKELGRRELISLSLLFLVLFWGKVNIAPLALLPFLIIKPSQYKMRYGYYIVLIISIALFLIEVAGWNLFAYSRYHDALAGANPSAQIKFIFANPFRFSAILTNNIWMNRIDYLRAWIAIYGLDYWPVPIWTFYLYGAGLLTGLFIKGDNAPEKRTRMGLVIVYIAGYLGTIVSLYLSYTPAGSELVQGVQGRYFAGIMPLLFLALAGLPLLKQSRVPFYFPVVLAGLSLLLYVTGMYLSYHVTCGSQYYMPGLCYQPNYKNWAPNDRYSEPITKNLSLTQEIASECNRMKELRVWIDASAADPVGITEFTLSDVIRDHKVISLNVLNSKLPNKNWYTLYFPTQPDSNGKLYLLAIREDEKSKAGPRFSYSLQSEYLEGRLYENNQPVNTDLIFQAGCSAGWTK
jgi:uncharacterized membrane protein